VSGRSSAGRPAQPAQLTVLLVEDDEDLRTLVAALLRKEDLLVIETQNGAEMMAALALANLHGSESRRNLLIVTDFRLPIMDGLSAIRSAREHGTCAPFILMTGFGDPAVHAEASRLGALAVLDKPFDLDQLRSAVLRFARSRTTP
jgi:DNA-binding NtrC family response regulator